MTEPGLISTSLDAELREQARQHGILVWLDKEGPYTSFVDALAARQLGLATDPRSLRGRLATALAHPLTVGGALLRGLRR